VAEVNAVFDTNLLIDFLSGVPKARDELARFESVTISIVTWMEVLAGAGERDEEETIRRFLRRFTIHPIDAGVAERAVAIRREMKIRLPDAIIWGTAQHLGQVLVTRNTRDFPARDPGIRIPYKL
jgi:predicted nucleic acid-binding protein